jgi:TPR repeat protein
MRLANKLAAFALIITASVASAQDLSVEANERIASAQAALNKADYSTAGPILAELCDEGVSTVCFQAGIIYGEGRGVQPDLARTAVFMQRGCETGGSADACAALGQLYFTGAGVEMDLEKSTGFYALACAAGSAHGCVSAGEGYELGRGVAIDLELARAMYEFACDEGHAVGCTSLGSMHAHARPDPKSGPAGDFAKAAGLFGQGCDGGDAVGCGLLADLYEQGAGVEQDNAKALELYRHLLTLSPEQWVKNSAEGRIAALTAQE